MLILVLLNKQREVEWLSHMGPTHSFFRNLHVVFQSPCNNLQGLTNNGSVYLISHSLASISMGIQFSSTIGFNHYILSNRYFGALSGIRWF